MSSSSPTDSITMPSWPKAYPDTCAVARFKSSIDDFCVNEIPLTQASGEGEHIWLHIEKKCANTSWVAQKIATFFDVKELDVGYAGMKDRYAVTRQWFSVYFPKGSPPDISKLVDDEFVVLEHARHIKKIRRGDLIGNQFRVVLRDINGDREQIEHNLASIQQMGFPNYFGKQRFGHDGNNIEQGRLLLLKKIRVRNRTKKSLYLSAVRSFLFNTVLAGRIREANWQEPLLGEVLSDCEQITGPLWGRGRLASQEAVAELEQGFLAPYQELCNALEHAGLKQERRELRTVPANLIWHWCDEKRDDLELSFTLPPGTFATALLDEVCTLIEPERENIQ